MMPPVGLGIAVAVTARRGREEGVRAPLPSPRSRARMAEDARLRAIKDQAGERMLAKAMTILLLATICIATFMAWAWMHDTGRI